MAMAARWVSLLAVTALPGRRCIGVSSEGLVPQGVCGVGPGVTPVLMSGVEVIGV